MPTPLSPIDLEEFRTQLCAEAERQLKRSGVVGLSMRSLARAMGCSATTPYKYIKNKGEIVARVRASILNQLCQRLEEAEKPTARDWTLAQQKVFVDFAFDEPASYRLIFDVYQHDESHFAELVEANARAVRACSLYVGKLIEEGLVDGDAVDLGYMFFSAMHGLVVLRMAGRPHAGRSEFDEKCRRYFALIVSGVGRLGRR